MTEPRPVIPLSYAGLDAGERRQRVWEVRARWLAVGGWATAMGAWLGIVLISVELAVVSGPCLLAIGVLLILAGWIGKRELALGAGVMHCAICLLFLLLVNLLNWSPRDAQTPFAVMGAIYLLPAGVVALVVFFQQTHVQPPNETT